MTRWIFIFHRIPRWNFYVDIRLLITAKVLLVRQSILGGGTKMDAGANEGDNAEMIKYLYNPCV